MQRYFIDEKQVDLRHQTILIDGSDVHHILNVMRMKKGDQLIVSISGQGSYLCAVDSMSEQQVQCIIVQKLEENKELPSEVVIAQGLVRREKAEEVLRRLAELGASGYLNIEMERSVVRLKEGKSNKLDRWNKIAKEACEQAHRSKIMKLYEVLSFSEFLSFAKDFDLCFFAYEEEGKQQGTIPSFTKNELKNKRVVVLVGPEGGFSQREVQALQKANFRSIGLGPRILRTETAPLYIMSVLAYILEKRENEN